MKQEDVLNMFDLTAPTVQAQITGLVEHLKPLGTPDWDMVAQLVDGWYLGGDTPKATGDLVVDDLLAAYIAGVVWCNDGRGTKP